MKHKSWMSALDQAVDHLGVAGVICPNCGQASLTWRFVGNLGSPGWGAIWCEKCRHGILLSRVLIPDFAPTVEPGKPTGVPEFTVVPPGE